MSAPLRLLQGALLGLLAGLAMAFWVGIGSFVMRLSGPPPLNDTIFANVSASTAPPR